MTSTSLVLFITMSLKDFPFAIITAPVVSSGKTLGQIVEFKEVLGAYLSGDEGEVVKGKNGE